MSAVLETVFWGSVAAIGWTYVGFPLVLALRRPLPPPRRTPGTPPPRVSYVIVVHNEREVIEAKLTNVEALDYPRDRLEVIVASDGSDDGTDECVARHAGPTRIQLLSLPRVGKNAALDAAVEATTGEILAFSDADSMLEPGALRALVAPFQDPSVGGVGGDYRYEEDTAGGASERRYWSLDRVWKTLESRSGSVTSATGQIYAIRRAVFDRVPDGVTDDFFVSTGAIAAGLRLVFEPGAVAHGPVAETTEAEYRRKLRLMTRGFASVHARRQLLDPRRTGFYAIQLATHKIARRLVGLPLIGLAVSAPLLAGVHPFYALAALGQAGLYGLAVAGFVLRTSPAGRHTLLALPLFFVMANWAGLRAGWDFLRGRRHRVWVPQRTRPSSEAHEPRASSAEGG
jgi:cellulose synthase/poly-beta-1,6-N-acetylglucosamine synthase-like glycosyltransferase